MTFFQLIVKVFRGIRFRITRWSIYVWRKRQYVRYNYSDSIKKPLYISPQCIEMGKSVSIWYHARIEGVSSYNKKTFTPSIILHDNVSVQQNFHLTCARRIEIGSNTAIAANVTITDIHHPYTDVVIPIERQDIEVNPVIIGSDCKIYNNAVILPGTVIGRHCTIGANSVVSGHYPDYCVIVGSPAKIVKKYDEDKMKWRKTNNVGDFID